MTEPGFLRRYSILLLIPLLLLATPGAIGAETDLGLGYYFLSVKLPENVDSTELKKHGDNLAQWLLMNNCTTSVHGPYRSKRKARRALREQKRQKAENIYFTGIYRL